VFDHVTIRAADPLASQRFYSTVLSTLGIEPTEEDSEETRWRGFRVEPADPDCPPTRNLHLAFVAPSRQHVDEFWRVGTEAAYEDAGRPGERPQYTPDYYGAFLRDPNGNSAEAVRHRYVRGNGSLDHLWIRVPDLEAAVAFYEAVAPHAGLREGRRWDQGRQFRGARATFSLVDDGAPLTEGVHMAFPAIDMETVDGFHRAALAVGCRDVMAPERRDFAYSARVLDPSGASVESVFRDRV
jgi:catechol 2,3-dioxygenase-like lactoylglutathione lyase family enzyme